MNFDHGVEDSIGVFGESLDLQGSGGFEAAGRSRVGLKRVCNLLRLRLAWFAL